MKIIIWVNRGWLVRVLPIENWAFGCVAPVSSVPINGKRAKVTHCHFTCMARPQIALCTNKIGFCFLSSNPTVTRFLLFAIHLSPFNQYGINRGVLKTLSHMPQARKRVYIQQLQKLRRLQGEAEDERQVGRREKEITVQANGRDFNEASRGY